MVCNDPEAEQEVLPGENNRSTGMDSTVLHWVLRVQELNVCGSSGLRSCCNGVFTPYRLEQEAKAVTFDVQGVVQDRTTDLQSCELRLSELHQELERHLEQQVHLTS